jgi:hypothetical protein
LTDGRPPPPRLIPPPPRPPPPPPRPPPPRAESSRIETKLIAKISENTMKRFISLSILQ